MSETESQQEVRRSLAGELRARADTDLVALLRARPDLTSPVPSDIGQLAARATTRASVARALDRLDRSALAVVEALVQAGEPGSLADVTTLLPLDETTARDLVDRLRLLALVCGPDDGLRLVRVARDIIGVQVAGLGPPVRHLAVAL